MKRKESDRINAKDELLDLPSSRGTVLPNSADVFEDTSTNFES